MAGRWPAWLAAYVASQVALYFSVKEVLGELGPALFLPAYLLGTSALLALAAGRVEGLSGGVVKLGLMQAASAALWLSGLYLLPPAPAAAINYFMPFVAMGLGAALLGEGLDAWEAAGAAVGGAGVALFAAYSVRGSLSALGVALTLANTVTWASYSLYYRRLGAGDPAALNAASLLVAGLASLPALALGLRWARPGPPPALAAYLLASLASSALGYVSWTELVRSTSVARATLSSYAAPAAIAAVQAALGEPVAAAQAAGLGIMVLGAAVAFGGEGRRAGA